MKATRSFALIILFFLALPAKSQEQANQTYRIIDNGTVQNVQPYIDALNSANMKYHRLKNTRFIITFSTGVKVELFSAAELIAAGRNINLADYPETFINRVEPIFSLGPNNIIMEQRPVYGKYH
ncbi:MAG: hypothetical protein JWO44_251 [Bacteroidetes bacterium]|jgi:hypothetical protein|nr:hypothetical protein [Bacteroidota bacterium]